MKAMKSVNYLYLLEGIKYNVSLLIIMLLSLIILLGNYCKEVEVNYMVFDWKSRLHFKYTNYKEISKGNAIIT